MMRDVSIIGCGMTKFGRLDRKDLMDILAEASLKAIDDAGASERDFDSVYVGNMLAGELSHQTAIASALVDRINLIPASAERIENGPASGGSAVKNGFLSVASGASDLVLVAGGEKMTGFDTGTISDLMSTLNHPTAEYVHGATMPAMAALFTRLYMERYKLTERHLAMVAVKNHANGMRNPCAQLQKLCTVEDAMSSAMVSDPLRLYYCCPISDGAAALVLCPSEKAKEFTEKPVKILGFGHATDTHTLQEREEPTVLKSVRIAAPRAFDMSRLRPENIDVAELHDAFEILEIAESEDIGFFKKGEGQLALEKGVTNIDGKLPVNPSGGLKAKGHPVGATGVAQIVELVWQLRGEAGKRQVKDPKHALACNFGGFGNNTVVHILERGD
jgi:acetyl-CoA C-acetyltransferase